MIAAPHRFLHNPDAVGALPTTVGSAPVGEGPATPREFHRRLAGYAATPLHDVPELAGRLGVGQVLVKDESLRLALPSYKVLGASWATYRAILASQDEPIGAWDDIDQLRGLLAHRSGTRLVAATDGNHGRAVARVAALLGWTARILVPAGTARARTDAIAGEGAEVEIVDGTYDEAVAAAAAYADEKTLVISDTAWPGYRDIPSWVIDGYSTIFAEVDEDIERSGGEAPTHVVIPVGVGALAAAAVEHWRAPGRSAMLIAVEPDTAACVMASVAAGVAVEVPGPHLSMMAGLNCGLPSPLALPRIQAGFEGFVAVNDSWAADATRALSAVGLDAGESAAAGLGGLLALTPGERAVLGLDSSARVMFVMTEGVTDPASFARILAEGAAA